MKGGPGSRRRQLVADGDLWYSGQSGPVTVSHATPEELARYREIPAPTKRETVYTWEGGGRRKRMRLRLVEQFENR